VRLKRRIVTALVVVASAGLFFWQWSAAPRVQASASVTRQLPAVRGELYLGDTFEGLPLRAVRPFLYSDCIPGKAHELPCAVVRVAAGRLSGSDPKQLERARDELRPVRPSK